jgi:hypothetical protein
MAFTPERRRADPGKAWTGTERRRGEPNRDPITGAPGAHPVGTGLGAAAGVAEAIDPTAEEAYWSQNYTREPYYERGYSFADYHPGYRTGWEGRARYQGRTFDEVENDLEFDYARIRGKSRLEWEKNRHAARAAWERFDPDGEPLEGSH